MQENKNEQRKLFEAHVARYEYRARWKIVNRDSRLLFLLRIWIAVSIYNSKKCIFNPVRTTTLEDQNCIKKTYL